MNTVLVTGAAGNLGRHVCGLLRYRGHDVRAMVHRSRFVVPGVEIVDGDVVTGAGIDAAVAGVDAVIHTATVVGKHAEKEAVAGTVNMARTANRVGAHFLYPSKVGADTVRLPTHDAKWEAECAVEDLGGAWTILRATQFHNVIDELLGAPVFFKAPGLVFQPVDVAEVAWRLIRLMEAGPAGRAPDYGGPELLSIEELAARRREITGRRAHLVRVPRKGLMRDLVAGLHLCPEHRDGGITWDDWLERSLERA